LGRLIILLLVLLNLLGWSNWIIRLVQRSLSGFGSIMLSSQLVKLIKTRFKSLGIILFRHCGLALGIRVCEE
jgi:hypothetical protein